MRPLSASGDIAQHPQEVLPEDLLDVLVAISPFYQDLCEIRILGDILESGRRDVDAVEIGAEAHVVRANEPDDVVDVIRHRVDRGRRDVRFAAGEGEMALASELIEPRGVALFRHAEGLHHAAAARRFSFLHVFLVEILGIEVDPDNTAVLAHRLDHLVAHVARVIAKSTARGMRGDHGFRREAHHVPERCVRNVRDVDDHTDAVHLSNDVFPERAEAVEASDVRRGVRPVIGVEMGQSHVADTEAVEHSQNTEIVLDSMAALDAHEGGELALRHDATNIRGGRRELDAIGRGAEELIERVDLL